MITGVAVIIARGGGEGGHGGRGLLVHKGGVICGRCDVTGAGWGWHDLVMSSNQQEDRGTASLIPPLAPPTLQAVTRKCSANSKRRRA